MQERVTKLETLFALQDQTLTELHQELFKQQQEITHLKQQILLLSEKLALLEPSEEIAGNEKPPHY